MIDSFTGEFSFLSNFYACDVQFEGKTYPSTEHAYQAAKTLDKKKREEIRKTMSPGRAKRLGGKLALRKDWESVKVGIMHGLLQQKFKKGSPLADLLLKTGSQQLVEGNTWGDRFWGQTKNGGRWVGKNQLGRLLMLVRQELQMGGHLDPCGFAEEDEKVFEIVDQAIVDDVMDE